MEKFRKYAHCEITGKWVPRDEMLGATVKLYSRDGSEMRVPIRLSQAGMAEFMNYVRGLEWRNELVSAEGLPEGAEVVKNGYQER